MERKVFSCRKCHEKSVVYDQSIYNWICASCGAIEGRRNKDGSLKGTPIPPPQKKS